MKAQDLKNSILQLAIQGKLVAQDANDEPAEVLYAKIQAEKQKLIKEGKIKKNKPLPPITDEEIPFEIPSTWKWVRLGDIFAHNTGKALNSSKQEGKLKKYITTSNVYWNYFQLNEVRKMRFNDDEIQKCTVTKGDLLVCEGGDIGRAAIWNYDYDICIQNHIHRLRAYSEICTMFFYYIFFLYKMAGYIGGKGIGIQGLSSGALHNIWVPLPPLAEQKRIVAKIEELEPLVKQYDKAETELSALNDSFPEQLKKSILQYAIQGKLVAQDANDEPAEVLYAKIQSEKQKLIKEGKIKKDKPLPPITEDEIPFEILPSWKWVRLGEIIDLLSGRDLLPTEYSNVYTKGCVPYITGASNFNDEKIIENRWTLTPAVLACKNDLLLTCKGTIGAIGFLSCDKAHIARQIMAVRIYKWFDINYLKYFLMYYVQVFQSKAKSIIPGIARDDILTFLFPLPPLAEQKRIVAKVNELMQYCEELVHPEKRKKVEPITIGWLIDKGFASCQQNGYTDVNAILDELGIAVMQDRNLKKGRIEYDNNKFQIWVNDLNDNWTKTHELVHYVNDNNEIKLYGAVGRKDETSLSKSKERNVDALTAEILMPEDIFISAVEQENIKKYALVGNAIIRKLGKQFRVSDDAVKIRLQNLGYHTK